MPNRRARQAAQTRQDLLAAARALFAARGYAATSIKDIAATADVSVQTVYDSVGSKAELVRQMNDHVNEEAGVAAIASEIPTETNPRYLVAIPPRITCAVIDRCGDIVRATASGAASEAALRDVANEGNRRHCEGSARLAARLDQLDALRAGLTVDDAAATIAALSDTWFAVRLIDEYDWPLTRVEAWMTEVIERAVLPPRRRSR